MDNPKQPDGVDQILTVCLSFVGVLIGLGLFIWALTALGDIDWTLRLP